MDLNTAKWITLFLLFLLPLLVGSLTIHVFGRYRNLLKESRRGLAFLSYLNCFSGGFFLGTSLLVVLAQGLARFEEYRHLVHLRGKLPLFEIALGAGFFFVALLEKLVYSCFTHLQSQHCGQTQEEKRQILPMSSPSSNNTLNADKHVYENLTDSSEIAADTKDYHAVKSTRNRNSVSTSGSQQIQHGDEGEMEGSSSSSAESDLESSGGRKSVEVGSSGVSSLRIGMLVLALSFHTVFDGLAVGLQMDVASVFSLLTAIAAHKAVTSVVLGIELASVFDICTHLRSLLALLVFALASPLGVAIGIGVTSGHMLQSAKLLAGAMLQAVATGVFLYVSCFEILQREMVSAKDGAVKRVLVAMVGFLVITALEIATE